MRNQTLRFQAILLAAIFAIAVVDVNAAVAQLKTETSPPNVLFIAIDDLKPELGCYGVKDIVTPSIDKLADQSTVFLNAHCQFPVCGGSRASLMTGLRPESVGVMDLKTSMRAKNPDVVTMPQCFRNNGYATAAVGKIYDPRCVDNKKTNDAPSWSIPYSQIPHSKVKDAKTKQVTVASKFDDDELTDGWIRGEGVRLMRQLKSGDKPFFLAVGFKKPHLPFVAPQKYWDLYSPEQIQLAKHRGGIENDNGYSIHNSSEYRGYEGVPAEGPFSEELQRRSIHGYKACVSFIDAQVGLLLDELETLGLKENTIVVLWGDHGFHLGDHGMFGKHTTLEQATRVPLVIHVPGSKGSTTTSPVELCDIYPTLGELAGIGCPKLDGRSFKSVIADASQTSRDGALTVFKSKGAYGYSFRTQRYRYTEWVNKKSKTVAKDLYDYQTDPLETVNLADQPKFAEIQQTLATQLRAHAQGCERLKPSEVPAMQTSKTSSAKTTYASAPKTLKNDKPKQKDTIRSISKVDGSFPILVGAASNAKFWDTDSYKILNREFAYVTPGNDFKQTAIHPQPNKWKWKTADEWVERCKENGQVMRLHSPISPQCSKWAKSDERTGEELQTNLTEYMTEVCKRYDGQPHIRWMDVVNETVSRDGEWFGPREGVERWENPWPKIGVDDSHPLKPPAYIKMAFEIANEHAPNIKQILNQHGGMETAMWDKIKATIEYLQDAGIRVDGVGWQAHIDTGFENDPENVKQLRSLIEWAQSRKLEFHITEFNAWIHKDNKTDPATPEELKAQAKTYGAVLDILNEYSGKGVVTWCAWQIKDNETERGYMQGNLFDSDARPKPAYRTVLKFLKN